MFRLGGRLIAWLLGCVCAASLVKSKYSIIYHCDNRALPDVCYRGAEPTAVKMLPAEDSDPSVSPSVTSFHNYLDKKKKRWWGGGVGGARKLFCFMGVGGLGLTGATGVRFKCHLPLQTFEYLPHFCLTRSATLKQDVEISFFGGSRREGGGSHQSVCLRESDFSLIGQQSSLFKVILGQ